MRRVLKKIQIKLHKTQHICQIEEMKNTFRKNKTREILVCALLIGAKVKAQTMRCVTAQLSDPLHV